MASQDASAPAAAAPPPAVAVATAEDKPQHQQQKRIHSLVVDTGPLIKNEPALSTLLSQAEKLYTIPSVLAEIKDAATRSRVQTTLLPFLTLRNPRPESIRFVTDFSRRTGDLEVLSKPDIHLVALTYELELERNRGDWRIRKDPGQKGLNGKPPSAASDSKDGEEKEKDAPVSVEAAKQDDGDDLVETPTAAEEEAHDTTSDLPPPSTEQQDVPTEPDTVTPHEPLEAAGHSVDANNANNANDADNIASDLDELNLGEPSEEQPGQENDGTGDAAGVPVDQEGSDDGDDSDGWITPSNLKAHQAKDAALSGPKESAIQETLQAALLTSDFAMQNVALRINLNLVSPSGLSRIRQLKTWVLRCYGCFAVSRKMDRQFCPKCGQATLTRVSCSTDASGATRLHLKKNFVYNKRGNVYSVPKPTHGSANGKLANVVGGGKNHWGSGLILAEDQKEYTRKADEDRRARQRDLMDEDYLPNLVSGERTGGHGRIRVGAGRSVNAKKRR